MSAVDFVEVIMEETSRYEGAGSTTPYRLATEKLYLPSRSARISPAPAYLDRADELRGIEGAVPRLIDSHAPAGSYSVRAYPKALTWLLELAGFKGVHTAGDGVITDPDAGTIPANAHRWVYSKRTGIPAQSAQFRVNYAPENVLLTGQGFGVASLAFPMSGELTGDLVGLVVTRAAADTTTVPAVESQAIQPFRRGHLSLTWLSGGASINDFTFNIANPLDRVENPGVGNASFFPHTLEAGTEKVYVTGSIPKHALNATDYDALLNATTFAAKAKFLSTQVIGATTYHYTLWVEMPACQYVGGDADEISNARRRGATYDWFAAYDETAGYDCRVTLVNAVSSISTYV